MFSDELLEKILCDAEVAKVPLCYKYTMITAIERILDQEDKDDAAGSESEFFQVPIS